MIVLAAAPVALAQPSDDPVVLSDFTIETSVTEVTVPITVTGKGGIYVSGLEAQDFTVFDNGRRQKLTGFEVSFLPISMVICVQSSSRVEGILPDVRKTAILFTEMVLGEFGQAALIAFDQRVRLMQDFTSDDALITKALKKITIGSDAVRLSDAVFNAIRMLVKRPSNHRKVIVVISESQETASVVSLGETMRTAQIHEIMIYPVRLSSLSGWLRRDDKPMAPVTPPGIDGGAAVAGVTFTPTTYAQSNVRVTPNVIPIIIDLVRGAKNLIFSNPLELLATGTGGRDYSPRTEDGLQESIIEIGKDLRSQYLLSYSPNNLNDSGMFHRIRVKIPYEKFKLRFRPGYWQGPSPVADGEPAEPEPASTP